MLRAKPKLQRIKLNLQKLKLDLQELRFDLQELKFNLQELKLDLQELKLNLQELNLDLQGSKLDLQRVKTSMLNEKKDGIYIMFTIPNEHDPHQPHFAGSFYFNTNDVEAWWLHLKDHSEIIYPICDFEYGMREFAVKDCNGYTLQFGQHL